MSDLNVRIRAHVDNPSKFPSSGAQALCALRAVLDQCEQLRPMRVGPCDEPVGRDIADEFEQTIARALGITD